MKRVYWHTIGFDAATTPADETDGDGAVELSEAGKAALAAIRAQRDEGQATVSFDCADENDIVYHPQTGERLLIPQVCCQCGSGNLGPYTVQGDFLPGDGWRICGNCDAINGPLDESQVCPRCGGYGGHFIYALVDVATVTETACPVCGGTGRREGGRGDG